jgi:hypothetical protein
MSGRGDDYRRNADEAEKKADQVSDYRAKQIHRDIAAQWREAANDAEQRDK